MPTGLVHDDRFLDHDTGPNHPERPERLRAVVAALRLAAIWDRLVSIPAAPADLRWVERVHERAYVERLRAACELGEPYIDVPDSAIGAASFQVALLAAGSVMAAADAVMAGRVRNAFCAVRPPGHHAERDRSMGFCLLNNVAIAAEYLIAHHKLARVAIVDFDVHHGNGTQHIFEHRPDVLFVSIHEAPESLYPGTGFAHETGVGLGANLTLNIPMPPGSGDDEYHRQFDGPITDAIDAFKPQAILLSAGFDAAQGDPLAHMEITPHGYEWITRHMVELAEKHCGGRLISTLEGGYNLRSLARCVTAHVTGLIE